MIRLNRASLTLLVALFIGWVWDLFFYDSALGLSVPLYALLLTAALFGLGWLGDTAPQRHNLWLLPPLFFFAAMVPVRANLMTIQTSNPSSEPRRRAGTEIMKDQNARAKLSLWFKWASANALGQILSLPLGCAAAFIVGGAALSIGEVFGWVVVATVFGAISGAVVGTMQWAILGQRNNRVNGWIVWIMASIAGGAFAWAVISLFALGLFTASYGLD